MVIMKTNYKEIFKKIQNKFDISHKLGYVEDDFMRDMFTLNTKVKLGNQKMNGNIKCSEQLLNDSVIFNKVIKENDLHCSKPLWRINEKRVRHGLASWI